MWDIIKRLMANGTTILLTTQYLEEADQLADKIIVIDGGKVIAEGTAKELKSKIGNDRLEVSFKNSAALEKAKDALGKKVAETNTEENSLSVVLKDTSSDVRGVLDSLAAAKINLESMTIHKPTLDDVFLSLTNKQHHQEVKEEA